MSRSLFASPIALWGGAAAGLAIDGSGNLYVAENRVAFGNDPNGTRILKVTPSGVQSTVIGPGTMGAIAGIAVDSAGNLYVADGNGTGLNNSVPLNKVWKVDPQGNATTFVAVVNDPTGVALDPLGNLAVSSFGDSAIYRYSPAGALLGTITNALPGAYGLAFDASGNLYVAAVGPAPNHDTRIFRVDAVGQVSTFANPGFPEPVGLAFDPRGDLWATYYDAFKLVRVTSGGAMTIYPGGWTADDAANGVVFDAQGAIYFAVNGGRTTTFPAVVKVAGASCAP